jgi:RNA polymerase sigma factor (sigma-70 family)
MRYEQEQLTRIAAGDQTALKALYDLYYPRLARFLLRVTGDPVLVPQLIKEVWLTVQQYAASRGDADVSTWILGIAWSKAARSVGRSRSAEPPPEARAQAGRAADATRRDLETVLARLSPEQRAIVELTFFFGYAYGEIAAILGCAEATVKNRMFHARRELGALKAPSDG